jgi:hypothetical protein
MPAEKLAPLFGEPEARKRAERSERNQPKGSTGDNALPNGSRKTNRQRKTTSSDAVPAPPPPAQPPPVEDRSDILDAVPVLTAPTLQRKRAGSATPKRRSPSPKKVAKNAPALAAAVAANNEAYGVGHSAGGDANAYRTVATMRSRLYYDDRKERGTHELRNFSFCTQCDERIPADMRIVSVSEALRFIHAAKSAASSLISRQK